MLKTRKEILLLFTCFLFFACNKCNEISTGNSPSRPIDEIKQDVIEGDENAYFELRSIYLDYPPEDFLYWSLLMANKNDFPIAYFDVFQTMILSYVGGRYYRFYEMDIRTQNFTLEYLKIASDKGVKQANEILILIQDKSKLDSLKREEENIFPENGSEDI